MYWLIGLDHDPGAAISVYPTTARPTIAGATVLAGVAGVTTALVVALVAVFEPPAFVPVTVTLMPLARSFDPSG